MQNTVEDRVRKGHGGTITTRAYGLSDNYDSMEFTGT